MKKLNTQKDSLLIFPLQEKGYSLSSVLNNQNRWQTKLVCSIEDDNHVSYVSTTYSKRSDYLKLIETTRLLGSDGVVYPKITEEHLEENTVVCRYIGDFFTEFLLENPAKIGNSLVAIFAYLKNINAFKKTSSRFSVPCIVREALQSSKGIYEDFNFLPRSKNILFTLENSGIKFIYGCGVEDPHIWNFRVLRVREKIKAFTTDFDYFSDRINYFWEIGYLYATFRWIKKRFTLLTTTAQETILSLVQNIDIKSEFMFWLGVLSSYCGYRDKLFEFIKNGRINELHEENQLIQQLDKKVSSLGEQILVAKRYQEKNRTGGASVKIGTNT